MLRRSQFRLTLSILVLGLSVFLVQMTFASLLPQSFWVRTSFTFLLLVATLIFYEKGSNLPRSKLLFLYFTASVASLLSSLSGDALVNVLKLSLEDPNGIALAKFAESTAVVLVILLFMGWAGIKREQLYLNRGNLRRGLLTGILFFLGFSALTLFTGDVMPLFNEKMQNNDLGEISKLIPWVLVFCFSNAIMEELLFRGLFLKYFDSLLGFRTANILTALIFAVAHMQVTYATSMIGFLLVVFALGLLLGSVMKKTESIIAPILIHAGADVMLILPMFSKYL